MPNPVVGIGGAMLGSSAIGAGASMAASKAQAKSAKNASELQWQMYQQNRKDMEPWRTVGADAIQKLSAAVDAGPPDYTQTPGYTFRLNEGNKQINRNAQLLGNMGSGGHEKALLRFGQDYATNDFDNNINRWLSTKIKPYQSLAGAGQQSAHATAQLGFGTGQNMSGLALGQGTARASGYNGIANSFNNGVEQGLRFYEMGGFGGGGGSGGGGFGDPSSASYYPY